MIYPDSFNSPVFPAGPRIAVSRVMAIGAMVVFALIIVFGGLIFWARASQKIHPFLVTVDDVTGAWTVVGHNHGERTITRNRAMQESVIANFTKQWFTVSANAQQNDDLWYGFEEKSACFADDVPNRGQIYCRASDELYNRFIYNIVPEYQVRIAAGETWSVDVDNIYLNTTSNVTDNGGTWRILVQVDSNIYGPVQVMAYATLAQDVQDYPNTLGFYVADFNAYRVDDR